MSFCIDMIKMEEQKLIHSEVSKFHQFFFVLQGSAIRIPCNWLAIADEFVEDRNLWCTTVLF